MYVFLVTMFFLFIIILNIYLFFIAYSIKTDYTYLRVSTCNIIEKLDKIMSRSNNEYEERI